MRVFVNDYIIKRTLQNGSKKLSILFSPLNDKIHVPACGSDNEWFYMCSLKKNVPVSSKIVQNCLQNSKRSICGSCPVSVGLKDFEEKYI